VTHSKRIKETQSNIGLKKKNAIRKVEEKPFSWKPSNISISQTAKTRMGKRKMRNSNKEEPVEKKSK